MPLPLIAAAANVTARAGIAGVRVVARGTVAAGQAVARGTATAARGATQGASRATQQGMKTGGRFAIRRLENLGDKALGADAEKQAIRNERKQPSLLRPQGSVGALYRSAPIPDAVKRAGYNMLPGSSKSVARRMGMTPPVSRSRAQKDFRDKKVTYRIPKGTGRAMVAFAFFLDMLPIILAVVVLFAAFQGPLPPQDPQTEWWNAWGHLKDYAKSLGDMAGGAFKAFTGIVIFAPAAYFLASLFVPIIAFLFFLIWFLSRKVSPFSVPGALIMVLETMPLANLLPAITLVVWRRVRASRKEDELQHALSLV